MSYSDAAFIVTACNSHNELVARLERVIRYFGSDFSALNRQQKIVLDEVRATLAKVVT